MFIRKNPASSFLTYLLRAFSGLICLSLASTSFAFAPPATNSNMPPRSSSRTSLCSSAASSTVGGMRIGFIGTGTIASAIVTGFSTQSEVPVETISVSKRSATKSKALRETFPELVKVYDDNQKLIDQSDIIFITVLPEQTKQVLEMLKFDERHILISLVSTSKLPELEQASGVNISQIYKMICLPAVASHDGVCILLGGAPSVNTDVLDLLDTLGGVVQAESEEEMSIMMVPSGLMGSFYGILKNNRDWLVKQGIPVEKANLLVTGQYHSMMVDANSRLSSPTAYEDLIHEQTPGGLNEQGLQNNIQMGTFNNYNDVQDAMLKRILGISDGSVNVDA